MQEYNILGDRMEITVEKINSYLAIVSVIGEIDLNNTPELTTVFEKLRKEGIHQHILECSNISYIDSSGIGVLIKSKSLLMQEKSDKSKDIILLNLSPSVKRVFELTRLTGLFKTFNNRLEAIDYFNK